MLAFGVSRDSLPLAILDGEIDPLKRQGVRFTMNTTVGRDLDLEQVEREFDAVVLATGAPSGKDAETAAHGVSLGRRGIAVQPGTFLTSRARVFACGGAIVPGKLAARSVGQGRSVALVIDRFLVDNDGPRPTPERFDAHLTGIDIHEIHQLATSSVSATMDVTPGDFNSEIAAEAGRCLSCDCSVKDNCDLRRLATDYGIDQRRYRTGKRKRVVKTYHGSGVVFEPGKCLSCGRCVGITAKAGVRPGLSFHSRGFDVVVGAPFGAPVDQAMGKTIDACIAACPTGALSRIACLRGER
jgi:ferredoxin